MTRRFLAAAVLSALAALSACKRNAEPTPTAVEQKAAMPAQDAATQAPPDVEVISDAAHAPVSPEAAAVSSFDQKAYAGTFADAHTSLAIAADGTFKLNQGKTHISGTWTLEKDGEHLLFDPDSKAEKDLLYKMIGNDELQLEGGASQSLHRNKG
ncbi:MAG: hypothetical protein ABJA62_10325 [Luteimonas sp.]